MRPYSVFCLQSKLLESPVFNRQNSFSLLVSALAYLANAYHLINTIILSINLSSAKSYIYLLENKKMPAASKNNLLKAILNRLSAVFVIKLGNEIFVRYNGDILKHRGKTLTGTKGYTEAKKIIGKLVYHSTNNCNLLLKNYTLSNVLAFLFNYKHLCTTLNKTIKQLYNLAIGTANLNSSDIKCNFNNSKVSMHIDVQDMLWIMKSENKRCSKWKLSYNINIKNQERPCSTITSYFFDLKNNKYAVSSIMVPQHYDKGESLFYHELS